MVCFEWGPIVALLTTAIGTCIGVYKEQEVKPVFDRIFHAGHSRYTGFINKHLASFAILSVRVIAGYNLKNVDGEGDESDAYAVVTVGSKKCATETINNNPNPVWSNGGPWEFEVDTDNTGPENVLCVTVFDSNYVTRNVCLGALTFALGEPLKQGVIRLPLEEGDGGELELEIKLRWPRA
eukprot:TRINITY_DN77063_c0_g1_i1.p1 TRINITY_DN77063_c0_g1~~TRINITY_DN77063_c0_g1_i1.p1  ORF type:complete len:181 (+),score=24.92 TRINITY_DN77063_c0_g1_i1:63-605(+)